MSSQSVLITGGTGSFGRRMVKYLLSLSDPQTESIVVFSRDEMKQYELAFESGQPSKLQFIIGDVRDEAALKRALKVYSPRTIIHAAALKQVPLGEIHPEEFIKTNISGTENVIRSAVEAKVEKVLSLSTGKAVAPLNLYGATKLCADKLILRADELYPDTRFSVIRLGNILGSRGSVVPLFLKKKSSGILPVTHPDMTRFSVHPEEMPLHIRFALETMQGGEIFVPKCPAYRVGDLVTALAPECKTELIGLRPGEKMHEELIAPEEAPFTYLTERGFLISYLKKRSDLPRVSDDFRYRSSENLPFLTSDELAELCKNISEQIHL